MVTNQELNDRREPGCSVVLADKKYFHVGNWFMKRTLREHEWQSVFGTILIVPRRTYPQQWKNDAAILRFLRKETNIPLPPAECTFEDDGAFYFQSQYVDGIRMEKLAQQDKEVVMKEIEQHVTTLQALRSDLPGVPGESLLCPPGRVTGIYWKVNSCWRPREKGEYVFCHNNLREHNVIVDPETLKIQAIINWEFGGFWPAWFERPFWKRRGPSMAVEGEEDNVERCRDWLMNHCDEVEIPLGGEEPTSGQGRP
ncbi:aminoglycoside 3'-phosphotransferase/choline kinase domain protein [Metarhizium robertsii]|nr:aminoglycoside 3'-phosphotransferase/choline kinase domain protein [Metarhizium robertsii]